MLKFTDKDKDSLRGDLARIGKTLGYSRGTISKILHSQHDEYPQATVEKIQKALSFRIKQNEVFQQKFQPK